MSNTNNCLFIGGLGEPNWDSNGRKTWRQGRRVYDPNGISITISAIGGGIGGHAGLYLVENKNKPLDNNGEK